MRASATLTVDGQVIGTPAYMAPEQARGDKARVDARTDVYGLGVDPLRAVDRVSAVRRGCDQMVLAQHPGGGPAAAAAARRRDPARPRDRLPEGDGQGTRPPLRRRGRFRGRLAGDTSRGEPVLARPEGRFRMMVAEVPAPADAHRTGRLAGSRRRRRDRRRDLAMAAGRGEPASASRSSAARPSWP